jgi:hypothetical protein
MICLYLADLRNELNKEQGCRQKLEQDILESRRIRSMKKLLVLKFNFSFVLQMY